MLGSPSLGFQIPGPRADGSIGFGQLRRSGRADKQVYSGVYELVSGGAVHRPIERERLAAVEDLLDDQMDVGADVVPEPPQIGGRVCQSVHMVDAKPMDLAVANQFQREPVHVGIDFGHFHAHSDQAGDLEEAPIGQVPSGILPWEKLPGLSVEQSLQELAMRPKRVAYADTLEQAHAGRMERQHVVEIGERGHSIRPAKVELQFASGEHLGKRLSQNRQGQLVVPVDVEMGREAAVLAPRQHVKPPRILGRGGHVVGDDVEDQTEP